MKMRTRSAFAHGGVHEFAGLANGAGICKTFGECALFANSAADEITFGSITPEPREGNSGGETYYYVPETRSAVNSIGMRNPGWKVIRENLPDLINIARAAGKKIRISIAGFTPHDYFMVVGELVELLQKYNALDVVIIEINLGCPNALDASGKNHPVIAYNALMVVHIITGLYALVDGRATLAFKLSPYDETVTLDLAVRRNLHIFFNSLGKQYVGKVELVLCNTLGGQELLRPNGAPALGVSNNRGGLSGKGVEHLSKDNLRYFSTLLAANDRLSLVSSGGIFTADDVLGRFLGGASKVQMTTALLLNSVPLRSGLQTFSTVYEGLAPHMEE